MRRRRRHWGWATALACVVLSPVVTLWCLVHLDWSSDDTGVGVPRDGQVHRVVVPQGGEAYVMWTDQSLTDPTCTLTDDSGVEVPLRHVPREDRLVGAGLYAAVPGATYELTSPTSGVLDVRCDAIGADSEVGLAPAPHRLLFSSLVWGTLLLGPAMFLGGLVGLAVIALRRRRVAAHGVGPS